MFIFPVHFLPWLFLRTVVEIAGIVLTFAHTMGAFGVVLMIGGNIPRVSKVASIAIYDEVESMNYDAANFYTKLLIAVSFIILLLFFWFNKKFTKKELKYV